MERTPINKKYPNSFIKRIADVNAIYDEHKHKGLSNREIWRKYIYPVYMISERTFYNHLKKSYLLNT